MMPEYQFTPITVNRYSTRAERQAALVQIYRQVLERQPYAYERKILAQAEADFLSDKIGVRRFLKILAHSEVYLNSFYHNSSNLKFLELCFKHFMGRAPIDQAEIRYYSDILMHNGVNKCITAILDSEEYRHFFGCFTVPYPRESAYYPSATAYLETQTLNHELIKQRGSVVPTIYWHLLGLNCNAGACDHPEVVETLNPPPSPTADHLEAELLSLLQSLDSAEKAREAAQKLSPQQKAALRSLIR